MNVTFHALASFATAAVLSAKLLPCRNCFFRRSDLPFLAIGFVTRVLMHGDLCSCNYLAKRDTIKEKEEGKVVIAKIESFKKDNGKLPESLTEVDKDMNPEGPFIYTKESSTRYTLYAMLSMDRSYEYDSATQKWEVKP